MRYILAMFIGVIYTVAITNALHEKPYCDIIVEANGTWTGDTTNCVLPEWGVFHKDGTWDQK